MRQRGPNHLQIEFDISDSFPFCDISFLSFVNFTKLLFTRTFNQPACPQSPAQSVKPPDNFSSADLSPSVRNLAFYKNFITDTFPNKPIIDSPLLLLVPPRPRMLREGAAASGCAADVIAWVRVGEGKHSSCSELFIDAGD